MISNLAHLPKTHIVTNILRGIWMWCSIILMSILFSTVILVISPFVYCIDKQRHFLHILASNWAQSILFFNPWWEFKILGKEHLSQKGKAVIYVANHQSQIDILAVFILHTPFRWLGKASAFKVPLVGWAMRVVGYVPVLRGDKESSEKCLQRSAEHLKHGTPMFFFPEGTRTRTGELGNFKSGAFRLAKNLNIPVIPITLEGCAQILPKGTIFPQKAVVTITIHPPILSEHLSVNELMLQARAVILSQLQSKG